jgi:hypothetical protein
VPRLQPPRRHEEDETLERYYERANRELESQRQQQSTGHAPVPPLSSTTGATAAWPKLDHAAYHGVVGEVVRTIEPHTEADPIAILLQLLIYVGNMIDGTPHYVVESDRHAGNMFCVLVGQSAKGRKGTSGGRARAVVKAADELWVEQRMKGGLSTGEGLINEVRDGDGKEDLGALDKRLMVTEAEFGNALAVMERPGNTLSPVVRKAWDGGTLSTLTKHSPLRATNPHISIVGHITIDELRARITRTDMANGFANRFLYALVRRSKLLPHGGHLLELEIERLGERVKAAVEHAKRIGRVQMTDAAARKWELLYESLSAEQPGLLGAITARAEAQTVRLAMLYALLDLRDRIDVDHLTAAVAIWEFCEASAVYIFGDALGDPVADDILRALQQAGTAGMSRTDISNLLGRNRSADRIGAALTLLANRRRARVESRTSGGRPTEVWFAVRAA